ncbi:LuxR C-terminal-related transcriptional regulator [Dactylosporangium sp. NPDC051541]|uniref:helix-turn-helix transcriptional regulator n=1 Tax=Dactylosporangium sp. NPDC051541 TaxID=3363977 RepID=UPI0037B2ADAD
MGAGRLAIVLRGREADQALVAGVLRAPGGGVLVLRGDPGIGKSALLDQAAAAASGSAVLRCAGVPSESGIAYSGVHQLLGLSADGPAVLGRLAELAPVACFIDDAQWLDADSAQALRFAARRLPDAPIVMIFAGRDEFDAADLPAHRLLGLRPEAAEHLVADQPPAVRARLLAEAAGNPLALLELPRSFPDDHRPLPLPRRIQEAFAARLEPLPPATRAALLFVAADEDVDLAALFDVGCTAESLAVAETAGLIEVVHDRVAFTHPFLRAAVYRQPTFDRRLEVHRTLAAVVTDPVRRAWHLADAATGPNEEAASALEAIAARNFADAAVGARRLADAAVRVRHFAGADAAVGARHFAGADAAAGARDYFADAVIGPDLEAATALEAIGAWRRAAELSADPAKRSARLVAAASAADVAGHDDLARELLDRLPRDHAPALRARLAFAAGDPATAHELLVTAAAKAPKSEAGPLLVDAARNAWLLGDGPRLAEVAQLLHDRGLRAAAGLDAVRAAVDGDPVPDEGRQIIAELIADRSGPPEARQTAAFVAGLVGVFESSSDPAAAVYLGRFDDAAAAGSAGVRAWLAAVRGDDEECVRLAATGDRVWAEWALALLDLGRGRAAEAADRFEHMPAAPVFLVPDRVEAAIRAGRRATAEAATARLANWPWPSNWAKAALDRCNASLGQDVSVRTDLPWEAARTHLVLGERLRRERRKTEARGHLRAAAELFDRLGAVPWADRARSELRAAGEVVAASQQRNTLSPQELQIVKLAAAGRTNREIAAMLFISPKTVSYHLYRAFPKLGVTSRTQLAQFKL